KHPCWLLLLRHHLQLNGQLVFHPLVIVIVETDERSSCLAASGVPSFRKPLVLSVPDYRNPRIRTTGEDASRAVRAPVIDDDQLEAVEGLPEYAVNRTRKKRRPIERGEDDTHQRRRMSRHSARDPDSSPVAYQRATSTSSGGTSRSQGTGTRVGRFHPHSG